MHRQHNIKLCTFAYKFISKLHYLNGARLLVTRSLMDDISRSYTQSKRQKAQPLEDILFKLGLIT